MKIYSIFDDFDEIAARILKDAGGQLKVHPLRVTRPDSTQMKYILEEYDCVIIGTSQKISKDMFENIAKPKIIATASVGVDHIKVPKDKQHLITIINTPKANAQSVAEYTIGCILACCKRLIEGNALYRQGKNNKNLHQKPTDLYGKTLGVVGAGSISVRIMEYAKLFGMNILCWTRNPDNHKELLDLGINFVVLEDLIAASDVISVNLPNNDGTKRLISESIVNKMKDNAIFISVSRIDTINVDALFEKARKHKEFYVCLDLDVNADVVEKMPECSNVIVTPHIAGGTVEARNRMFREVAEQIAFRIKEFENETV